MKYSHDNSKDIINATLSDENNNFKLPDNDSLDKKQICLKCNTVNRADSIYCKNCGFKLDEINLSTNSNNPILEEKNIENQPIEENDEIVNRDSNNEVNTNNNSEIVENSNNTKESKKGISPLVIISLIALAIVLYLNFFNREYLLTGLSLLLPIIHITTISGLFKYQPKTTIGNVLKTALIVLLTIVACIIIYYIMKTLLTLVACLALISSCA